MGNVLGLAEIQASSRFVSFVSKGKERRRLAFRTPNANARVCQNHAQKRFGRFRLESGLGNNLGRGFQKSFWFL